MFAVLDEADRDIVVNAMEERSVNTSDTIIE
jgi:hypothetical protein